jgi:hypothetical protein
MRGTRPGGQVPGRTISPALTLDDLAGALLGSWDCDPVVSFTIVRTGPYTVTVKDQHGMSAAWISAPYADVVRHVLPWPVGVVVALLAIAPCLVLPRPRWHVMRRMSSARAAR